eukprot:361947-Chlamydomonas_euryale.AAC.10
MPQSLGKWGQLAEVLASLRSGLCRQGSTDSQKQPLGRSTIALQLLILLPPWMLVGPSSTAR